jgi:hypothetical protein
MILDRVGMSRGQATNARRFILLSEHPSSPSRIHHPDRQHGLKMGMVIMLGTRQ